LVSKHTHYIDINVLSSKSRFIHSYFLLLPLEHRASVKRFVSLQFLDLIDSR
jgi:hypothetical protein